MDRCCAVDHWKKAIFKKVFQQVSKLLRLHIFATVRICKRYMLESQYVKMRKTSLTNCTML